MIRENRVNPSQVPRGGRIQAPIDNSQLIRDMFIEQEEKQQRRIANDDAKLRQRLEYQQIYNKRTRERALRDQGNLNPQVKMDKRRDLNLAPIPYKPAPLFRNDRQAESLAPEPLSRANSLRTINVPHTLVGEEPLSPIPSYTQPVDDTNIDLMSMLDSGMGVGDIDE